MTPGPVPGTDPPCGAPCAELLQRLGFNAIRLGVMWAGAAPTGPGEYDADYLRSVAALVRLAADHGIHVLADMHRPGQLCVGGGDLGLGSVIQFFFC